MNKVMHFEIPYDDKDRAYAFYTSVFGWKLKERPAFYYARHQHENDVHQHESQHGLPGHAGSENHPQSSHSYTDVTTVATGTVAGTTEAIGAINGGMVKRSSIGMGPTSPIIAIQVDSIDDHVAKIAAAGGEVVMAKMRVANDRFYAYIKDTEGNVLGLWEETKK